LTFGEMFILKTIGLDQSIREPTPLPPPQGGGMRTLPTETCGPPPLPPTRSSGLISPTDHGSQGMRNQAKQGLARHRFSYLKLRSRPQGDRKADSKIPKVGSQPPLHPGVTAPFSFRTPRGGAKTYLDLRTFPAVVCIKGIQSSEDLRREGAQVAPKLPEQQLTADVCMICTPVPKVCVGFPAETWIDSL